MGLIPSSSSSQGRCARTALRTHGSAQLSSLVRMVMKARKKGSNNNTPTKWQVLRQELQVFMDKVAGITITT